VKAVSLVDFGSTFTKVALVDPHGWRLLARTQAPTTVHTDVMDGYREALAEARAEAGSTVRIAETLAASSAGGGLRMAAIGLVPELTAAAARHAALNAGARVELVLSGDLSENDVRALEKAHPEVILFSGGTDGGQAERVVANAEVLSTAAVGSHVVVACNTDVAPMVASLLRRGGRHAVIVENVMPRIFELNIEPARAAVHDAFIHHVIQGKALSEGVEFHRLVRMPTPEAVLQATELLASSAERQEGAADLAVVDVGGATTDVHSSSTPRVATSPTRRPLLPPPSLMRTVQGDLGVRWNAPTVLAVERAWLEAEMGGLDPDEGALAKACERRRLDPSFVAMSAEERRIDDGLAAACVMQALRRHCGTLSITRAGTRTVRYVEDGPDLRGLPTIVGTGGALIHGGNGEVILRTAIEQRAERSLTPRAPRVAIDRYYLLAAAGLLGTLDPAAAIQLMRSEIPGVQGAA
jgi:uncharacterized protein (TIGR01319 family)